MTSTKKDEFKIGCFHSEHEFERILVGSFFNQVHLINKKMVLVNVDGMGKLVFCTDGFTDDDDLLKQEHLANSKLYRGNIRRRNWSLFEDFFNITNEQDTCKKIGF